MSAGIIFYFTLFFYRNYRQELIEVEENQLLVMARTVGKSLVNYINQELESLDLYFSEPGLGNSDDIRDIRKAAELSILMFGMIQSLLRRNGS